MDVLDTRDRGEWKRQGVDRRPSVLLEATGKTSGSGKRNSDEDLEREFERVLNVPLEKVFFFI